MYVKPPASHRHGMKLPENYSGSAFSHQSPYSEMPPPARMHGQRSEQFQGDIAPSRDVPSEEIRHDLIPPFYERNEDDNERNNEETQAVSADPSIFSALLPKADLSSHFPFGHGIGGEELLILAVMLMVFLSGNESGEVDSEFLLLLGLLLFAG